MISCAGNITSSTNTLVKTAKTEFELTADNQSCGN